MSSQCIVIDYMQLPTIYKCSIVAMEMQHYVPYTLFSRFRMFHTAVNNINVPRCYAQWQIFLFESNQFRLFLTYFRKGFIFHEKPSTGNSDDTCDQKEWHTDIQDDANRRFSQLKRTRLNLRFLLIHVVYLWIPYDRHNNQSFFPIQNLQTVLWEALCSLWGTSWIFTT
jgi:hypothetical protein